MTKENRAIWSKILKARKLEIEKRNLLTEIIHAFTEEELRKDLEASNSDNIEETLNCYIDYGEDDDKLYDYLCERM